MEHFISLSSIPYSYLIIYVAYYFIQFGSRFQRSLEGNQQFYDEFIFSPYPEIIRATNNTREIEKLLNAICAISQDHVLLCE